ncbi:DUF3164 family protein [Flavobacterium sp. UMI-01]|uniref:DUF3164 family protein n=1 Tax=Flavobacterium sp. UMI-01 TaxID=1441053 RepID=UPI001C7D474B|nr:DUF3164 family protein [Flavobacterium sp. UMI-01]GIZ10257.1 hypothetical protein FUMI01_29810 [Flavobacterium sp. UMI-01]
MHTNTLEIPAELKNYTPEQLKAALQMQEDSKEADRKAYKELAEQSAAKAVFKLAIASEMLSNAKTEVFQYFENILKLKADLYGVKAKQQSHTFSFDGGEITIGYRINDGWDDTVNEGIAKVNNFISSLAKDEATAALVNVVFNLLKKDAKGNLKGSRVLELQKLTKEFNNEEFTDGVDIIAKAYKPRRSVWFVDAAVISEDGSKTSIPLAISSVDFSQGYKFDFYNEQLPEDASA